MTEASNFKDNNDGTVTDLEEDLCWCKKDSRTELEKWLNWDEAMEYVRVCNDQKYLGFGDWRIPTKSELRALLKNKKDYREIFLNEPPKVSRKVSDYKSGGEQSLWSSETRYGSYAWKSYFPSGKEVCVDQSVGTTGTSVRMVRDI
jgi:hypothetical protein